MQRKLYNDVQHGSAWCIYMARKTTGSRYRLGEPLNSELAAFCDALVGTLEIRVIREALRMYMDHRLATEPELRHATRSL